MAFWEPIAETYGLDRHVVNPRVHHTFLFMTLDHDGKIRMDCSSPYAMASLVGLKDQFDIAFGNDTDYDRHGIVTRSAGLMNPNRFIYAESFVSQEHLECPGRGAEDRRCRIGLTKPDAVSERRCAA